MIIKRRFYDFYQQELLSTISNSSKGFIYQYLVDTFCLQFYLNKALLQTYRKFITRFRLSSHDLRIESGRYNNTARNDRLYFLCNLYEIEDEFHFILKCPMYTQLRSLYLMKYCMYYTRPSVFKLIKLLSVNNISELCKLRKFLKCATELRSEYFTR